MPLCSHLDQVEVDAPDAAEVEGCEECLRDGTKWLHLRACRTCGHIGCCDSSPQKHASAHAAEAEHPIVTSAEPGEDWSWCYLDNAMLDLTGS